MACVYLESKHRTRLIRITVWAAIIGLLLGVLSSLAVAASAEAHAALRSIAPADGASLAQAPTQVVLTFDEAVSTSFATVTVTGPSGTSVSQGRARVAGAVVTQDLATGLGAGRYTVAFRVVSDDGHPVSDQTSFTVAQPTTSSPKDSASPTMTPLPSESSQGAAGAAAPPASASSGDDTTAKRIALAVGVGALALAAGTALVALSRRGKAT